MTEKRRQYNNLVFPAPHGPVNTSLNSDAGVRRTTFGALLYFVYPIAPAVLVGPTGAVLLLPIRIPLTQPFRLIEVERQEDF